MYLVSVSKTFNNKKSRRTDKTRSGKRKMAYYISESGSIYTKKEGFFSYYFKKYFKTKWKRRTFICPACANIYKGLVKNNRMKCPCPYCDDE